ncbi:hypothetical protein OIV42_32680, partial [Burkholderia pseudomallei]|nr:hypothetical protein [Burkholderia pseudomallei]
MSLQRRRPRMRRLQIDGLKGVTRESSAQLWDVSELAVARGFEVEGGRTERLHGVESIDVTDANERPVVCLFLAQQRAWPIEIDVME